MLVNVQVVLFVVRLEIGRTTTPFLRMYTNGFNTLVFVFGAFKNLGLVVSHVGGWVVLLEGFVLIKKKRVFV